MTLTKAEFLTGYSIRSLPPKRDGVRFGAFDGLRLVAEAEHLIDSLALRHLVEFVYAIHCREVLQQNGWRCSLCGRSRPLQMHHRRFRSLGGTHRIDNLEPLCWECHRAAHARRGRSRIQ